MPAPSTDSLTVAVTGASGALGQALLRRWHGRGAQLIALCHGRAPLQLAGPDGQPISLRQVHWQVGEEAALEPLLEQVDVLVINHGINVHGDCSAEATGRSLEVNALSAWRLLELFAGVAQRREGPRRPDRPRGWRRRAALRRLEAQCPGAAPGEMSRPAARPAAPPPAGPR
jgi:NAD(P)-dependent dehydrogenase (short-subunit alcohol dehydrogenase family)